ncbi:MAG: hypothetical protein AB8B87_10380 [Granulosicoccus sp.]
MNSTLRHWLSLSTEELDTIFSKATAGPVPTGDTRGTAIVTGALLPRTLARIARLLAWQGKVFDIFADDGQSGILINKVTPFSVNFIVAKVYRDKSWLDQKEAIVIDYSSTSFFAKLIRDEIRQVEPGLYLGKVWWKKTRILDFALSCPEQLFAGKPHSVSEYTEPAHEPVSGNKTLSAEPTPENNVH